ncbi:MAG: amidohydrolase [Tissierellia bacterium]|nr:amidohydrolase [Tissierellia bacterium]
MESSELEKYIINVFNKLHSIPEIAFEEFQTSAYIASQLKELDYEVIEKVGGTGVIGILDSGSPGPVLAVRADMDALEFEKDGKTYNVHACGHDAHSSMVLGLAKQVKQTGINKGKLYVVFQPAEEGLFGAAKMIQSGMLAEVEEMLGIHLRPIQEARLGQATPALVHGASNRVDISVKGLNAHGARPHLGINAVDAAVAIVNGLNAIKADPSVSHSVKVTSFKGGTDTFNLIPSAAKLVVDVRAQNNEVMEDILEKVKLAVEYGARSLGAQAQIDFIRGVPAADYCHELTNLARKAIVKELGESLEIITTPGGEDFHFYSRDLGIKTGYIGLGADLTPGLHHPDMSFDPSALIKGTNILFHMVKSKLG